ncbi:MAG: glycosyltransferase family 4 protein [Patescibacteria group bacterium]
MDKIIITTSRLVEKNGVGDLVESLKFLPDNISLWIIGGGQDEFKLKRLVSRLYLDSRVKFFGSVEPAEIPNYLAQADIFCRPSLSEGLGISFLEAMGAGLPTIGTAVGGIPDFLQHHETGWICEVRNPESVADQVRFIINPVNQVKVEEIVIRARKLVAEKYNWDTIAQDMGQIFQKAKI